MIKPADKVDAVGAAMIITFREVLSAIRRFGFQPNESVLIFGAGPVGLCFTKFCKLLGLKTVITTDVMDDKVEGARRAGADYAFNSAKCDIDAEVKRLFPDGIDYVVDAVGINALKKEEGEAHSQIMACINQGVLDPMDFISDVIEFEHILDAFALVEERRPSTKKIVIRYGE